MSTSDRQLAATTPQCCQNHSTLAELWCDMCKNNYCSACYKTVHATSTLQDHHPTPIGRSLSTFATCMIHPKGLLKYWCRECETVVCRMCQLTEHRNHRTRAMIEIAPSLVQELKSSIDKTQSSLDEMLTQATQLMNAAEKTEKTMVRETFASLRAMIDEREQALQQHIESISIKNKKLFEDYYNELKNRQQRLNNQRSDFMHITSTNDYTELLQNKKRLSDDLNTIAKDLRELSPPTKIQHRVEGINQVELSVDTILKRISVIEDKGDAPRSASSSKGSTIGIRKPPDCGGNACRNCGCCRDWKHSGFNWHRSSDASCSDFRYWNYLVFRHPAALQQVLGDKLNHYYFHRGSTGRHIIFDTPTDTGYHKICECIK